MSLRQRAETLFLKFEFSCDGCETGETVPSCFHLLAVYTDTDLEAANHLRQLFRNKLRESWKSEVQFLTAVTA